MDIYGHLWTYVKLLRCHRQMVTLRLESVLIGHVAQGDEIAIGIAVAVGSGLDQYKLLVFVDHLAIGGLGLGNDDLLQIANVLYAYSVRCLIAIWFGRDRSYVLTLFENGYAIYHFCGSPAVEATVGVVHIILLDNGGSCGGGRCTGGSRPLILWPGQDIAEQQGGADEED